MVLQPVLALAELLELLEGILLSELLFLVVYLVLRSLLERRQAMWVGHRLRLDERRQLEVDHATFDLFLLPEDWVLGR